LVKAHGVASQRGLLNQQGRRAYTAAQGGDRVHCPFCRHPDSRVIDSRTADDGTAIRRRRSCPECGRRFTTQETVILMVAKRSGVTEPFTRDKIIRGVQRACQGRPVSEDKLAILAQQVEETIRARGLGEVPSHEVGLAILGPLRDLDEVAYLRFASVYRGFESLADFEDEITALRQGRQEPASLGTEDTAPPRTAPTRTAAPAVVIVANGHAGPDRDPDRSRKGDTK
jgi:transcriptional repressor NrdR